MTAEAGRSHRPAFAPDPGGDPGGQARVRSLLLAGGGIRVAYQAGVLVALEEAGLTFSHADGASGGTMNVAMLLSGLNPTEMAARWRSLDVFGFASLPPLRKLLAGPPFPALSSTRGFTKKVFPHLGVDVDRIRAADGMTGTFNVCEYRSKENIAVPNDAVDEEILAAAVSLPVVSPALVRPDRTMVDSVWVLDTNVDEVVRRGADELWLVWCIGNHGVYFDGALQQYVHMIEISANASLFAQLRRVEEANATRDRPIRLHVIRPQAPIPLDPDYFFGRVDAGTLIAMGYRDAVDYLARARPDGVPLDATATRMRDPRPGIAIRETLRSTGAAGPGGRAGAHDPAHGPSLNLCWEIDDLAAFSADPSTGGRLVGDISHPTLGERRLLSGGHFTVGGGRVDATLHLGSTVITLTRELASLRGPVALTIQPDDGPAIDETVRAWDRPAVHARGVASAKAGLALQLRFWRLVLRARSGALGRA